MGVAVVRVLAGRPKRELVHLQLAHKHRARVAEPLGDGGVVVRHEVGQYLGAYAGADAARVVQVLESDGYAVQRAEVVARLYRALRRLRLCPRLVAHHGDERVERGVGPVDALEVRVHQFDGRKLLVCDKLGGLRYG